MKFFDNLKKDIQKAKQEKAAQINGQHLKSVLKKLKEQRDTIEKQTGTRPQIDDTTQMFMQKVLNTWIQQGYCIDEQKFWHEVDYNTQFDHPVEYYFVRKD